MSHYNFRKYRPAAAVALADRSWPNKTITRAPRWCSVDLRDGNQALPTPMNLEQKLEMFQLLVKIGFKEIEVGFPAAAQVEFDFARRLIADNLIPPDVTIQVLTQAREPLIKKTCQALVGARRAIIHLYNSTSALQRRVVFNMTPDEVKALAVQGTEWVKQYATECLAGTEVLYQYSPESFMGTELDFAVSVCNAVVEAWCPGPLEKVIINLPNTVEISTPNIWADRVEWMHQHISQRDKVILSVHCHNDRGTAVAASELGQLAGAERVEGTLFGNGERTGNVDIVTLALNLYTQGIDPALDFSNLTQIKDVYQRCTGLLVPPRHPYGGELVFTAFSGSHQDAINKGVKALSASGSPYWEVPYLPLNPKDVGREYEPIIRINSQSGKGGVAYIMEEHFGLKLPKAMHPEFGAVVQVISDRTGAEVLPTALWEAFTKEYLDRLHPFAFLGFNLQTGGAANTLSAPSVIAATVKVSGQTVELAGSGNGPIDAFVNAWQKRGLDFTVVSYDEHALEKGSDARAVTYIQIIDDEGRRWFGVGVDHNIISASLKAIVSALNRMVVGRGLSLIF